MGQDRVLGVRRVRFCGEDGHLSSVFLVVEPSKIIFLI